MLGAYAVTLVLLALVVGGELVAGGGRCAGGWREAEARRRRGRWRGVTC